VKWQATWEPEDELLVKYQNLIEDYWKVTVAEQNDLEHKHLLNNFLELVSILSDGERQRFFIKFTFCAFVYYPVTIIIHNKKYTDTFLFPLERQ